MSDPIPEIHVLLMQVESRFGNLSRPADFTNLSDEIENVTSEPISPSTLKRLWGYVNYMSSPRIYTLDVLSRYIGYADFGKFCEDIHGNENFVSGFLSEESVTSDTLAPGDRFTLPAIVKGFPLYIPHIERDGALTPLYVAGYRSGITLVKKL